MGADARHGVEPLHAGVVTGKRLGLSLLLSIYLPSSFSHYSTSLSLSPLDVRAPVVAAPRSRPRPHPRPSRSLCPRVAPPAAAAVVAAAVPPLVCPRSASRPKAASTWAAGAPTSVARGHPPAPAAVAVAALAAMVEATVVAEEAAAPLEAVTVAVATVAVTATAKAATAEAAAAAGTAATTPLRAGARVVGGPTAGGAPQRRVRPSRTAASQHSGATLPYNHRGGAGGRRAAARARSASGEPRVRAVGRASGVEPPVLRRRAWAWPGV